MAVCAKLLTKLGGASVLPDYRWVNRLTGSTLPDHYGFTLIGDADGLRRHSCRLTNFSTRSSRGRPDLLGIVPNPTVGWIVLLELTLGNLDNVTTCAEQNSGNW